MTLNTRTRLRVVATLVALVGMFLIRFPRLFHYRLESPAGFTLLVGGLTLVLYSVMVSAVLESCPHCGTPIPDNSVVCPHCKHNISTEPPPNSR